MNTLRPFLEHPARPLGTLRYHELQGFLFAIASAPELVAPSEWIPMVFGEHEAGYENLAEAKAVLGELMALYNSVNVAVASDRATLPADCTFRSTVLADLDDSAPLPSGRAASRAVISGSKSHGSRTFRRNSTMNWRRCS